ncbi:SDR family NAD(P)-dependent oxidoreductase [Argonema antarcticum]|uniref:SDR family NAD(P)-dependent oxidoreductase n=1 Tax=Argonema antarcticum TaxID=2942763 RepID=UPI002013A9EA|nr:SDR family oxidoreductase [Argonema antarcticum]MCL1470697.1 SDR family oxidoreductase [Argonema antarcticum A004/B2]
MNLKTRLKAALKSFINPVTTPKLVPPKPLPEPSVVIDNQLFAGKNVLITGAGRNIGRSIALEMAKQGANIFFTDALQERCTNLEKELNSYQVKSRGFLSDISNVENNNSLHSWLVDNHINIDILVNNVGIQFETIKIKNLDLGEWQKTFNTNVFGPMYLTKLISQMMVTNNVHGSIIFITSIHQWEIARWPSYSSSKAALGMIIKELAVELASFGIRVNGIAPGWVAEDEQGNPFSHEYTPLNKSSINPCYIGRAAVYLASDYFSGFTTGSVIKIDGGLSLFNSRVFQQPPQ